jgi:hypothetical protein
MAREYLITKNTNYNVGTFAAFQTVLNNKKLQSVSPDATVTITLTADITANSTIIWEYGYNDIRLNGSGYTYTRNDGNAFEVYNGLFYPYNITIVSNNTALTYGILGDNAIIKTEQATPLKIGTTTGTGFDKGICITGGSLIARGLEVKYCTTYLLELYSCNIDLSEAHLSYSKGMLTSTCQIEATNLEITYLSGAIRGWECYSCTVRILSFIFSYNTSTVAAFRSVGSNLLIQGWSGTGNTYIAELRTCNTDLNTMNFNTNTNGIVSYGGTLNIRVSSIITATTNYAIKLLAANCVIDTSTLSNNGIAIDDDTESKVSITALTQSGNTVVRTSDALKGWNKIYSTHAYASATTMTVPAGATSIYYVGMPYRWNEGATLKQAYIVGVADTVLTLAGDAITNTTITLPYYSTSARPAGFTHWFDYTVTPTSESGSFTDVSMDQSRFRICGKEVHYKFTIHIIDKGTAAGYISIVIPTTIIGDGTIYGQQALGLYNITGRVQSGAIRLYKYDGTTAIDNTYIIGHIIYGL